jgi:hypothetical protein
MFVIPPRSSARIIIASNSMGLGLEDCDRGCNQLNLRQPKITRSRHEILF